MRVLTPSKKREVWLVAEPTELAETRRMADEAAASFGLPEAERFAFAFAVNEAVSNAIEHGSPSPEGTIRLRFAEQGGGLVFSVQDYGGSHLSSCTTSPRRVDAGSPP